MGKRGNKRGGTNRQGREELRKREGEARREAAGERVGVIEERRESGDGGDLGRRGREHSASGSNGEEDAVGMQTRISGLRLISARRTSCSTWILPLLRVDG